jgi:hypothetical protein
MSVGPVGLEDLDAGHELGEFDRVGVGRLDVAAHPEATPDLADQLLSVLAEQASESLSPPSTWSEPCGGLYAWNRPLPSACWMNGGRVISTSAWVLLFSRTARCTISPEPPSTYLTSMSVFLVNSAKTRRASRHPCRPCRS